MAPATRSAAAGKDKPGQPESKGPPSKGKSKRKAAEEENAEPSAPVQQPSSPLKEKKAASPKKKAKTTAAAKPEASPAKETKGAEDQAAVKASKGPLKEGDLLPNVVVTRNDDEQVNIQDLAKDSGVIIFMYPRANTGGCTRQAEGFRDRYQEIKDAGFEVYGLSFDKPGTQTRWKDKLSLPYHLLTDDSGEFLKAVGALLPPRKVVRSHIVAAKGGKILSAKIKISPEPSFQSAAETAVTNKQLVI